jgi:Fur family transcriptional regulator, ferric uptake regulator
MERMTRQRLLIMTVIEGAGRPLSTAEILALAKRAGAGMGIATVYRAVKGLGAAGWLRAVDMPGSQVRYEKSDKGHHHHFHCRGCDRVFEMEGCAGDVSALTPRGFRMEGHEIIINGLCAGCLKKGC